VFETRSRRRCGLRSPVRLLPAVDQARHEDRPSVKQTDGLSIAGILLRAVLQLRLQAGATSPSAGGYCVAVPSLWLGRPGLVFRMRLPRSLSATTIRATRMTPTPYSIELHLRLAVQNGLIVMVLCFVLGSILGWTLSHLSTARLGAITGGAIVLALAAWSVWVYSDTDGLLHVRDRPRGNGNKS